MKNLNEVCVCVCVWGGGGWGGVGGGGEGVFIREGLCSCCKIHRGGGGGGGDYVHVLKFRGGGLCPRCKIQGGDYVHVYKFEQGGGILSVSLRLSMTYLSFSVNFLCFSKLLMTEIRKYLLKIRFSNSSMPRLILLRVPSAT